MRQSMSKAARAKWLAAVLIIAVADAVAQNRGAKITTREIVVSIPDRKLALVEDGRVVEIYPVAVGTERTPSPDGEFKIVNRVFKPTYYHKGVVIPAGPENPVGTRWIGLNQPHYGIHGTNAPHSIGKAASHGCIRLERRDLERLFAQVRIGDTVIIRAQTNEQTARIFGDDTILAQTQMAAAGGQ